MSRDYDSNFETESESEEQRRAKRKELTVDQLSGSTKRPKPSKNEFIEETDRNERRLRTRLQSMDAYSRHKLLVNEYVLNYSGSTSKLARDESKDRTEYEVLRDNHRFIWDESVAEEELTWGQRLAKKYWKQLFKEYCISDMSRYKDNRFGMRWRTEREVLDGKGQFSCGSKHCDSKEQLRSWEVLFTYEESGEKKSALVKLRMCSECSLKLNYKQKRKEIKTIKKNRKSAKRETKADKSEASSDEDIEDTSKEPEVETQSDKSQTSSSHMNQIWSKPQTIPDLEKPIDDEFDQYLEDLLV